MPLRRAWPYQNTPLSTHLESHRATSGSPARSPCRSVRLERGSWVHHRHRSGWITRDYNYAPPISARPSTDALTTALRVHQQLLHQSPTFEPYQNMLLQHCGVTDADIDDALRQVIGGATVAEDMELGEIRRALKRHPQLRDPVLAAMKAPSTPAAQHLKYLEMAAGLHGADKGTLGQLYHAEIRVGRNADGSLRCVTEVEIRVAQNVDAGMAGNRRIDEMHPIGHRHGNPIYRAVEVKAGDGRFSSHDINQLDDLLKAVRQRDGAALGRAGNQGTATEARIALLSPKWVNPPHGTRNLAIAEGWLDKGAELEVYNATGTLGRFTDIAQLKTFMGG